MLFMILSLVILKREHKFCQKETTLSPSLFSNEFLFDHQMAADYLGAARTTTTMKSRLSDYLATYRVGKAGLPRTTLIEAQTQYPESSERVRIDTEEEIVPVTTTEAPTTTSQTPESLRSRTSRIHGAHSSPEPKPHVARLKGGRESYDDWSVNLS